MIRQRNNAKIQFSDLYAQFVARKEIAEKVRKVEELADQVALAVAWGQRSRYASALSAVIRRFNYH